MLGPLPSAVTHTLTCHTDVCWVLCHLQSHTLTCQTDVCRVLCHLQSHTHTLTCQTEVCWVLCHLQSHTHSHVRLMYAGSFAICSHTHTLTHMSDRMFASAPSLPSTYWLLLCRHLQSAYTTGTLKFFWSSECTLPLSLREPVH